MPRLCRPLSSLYGGLGTWALTACIALGASACAKSGGGGDAEGGNSPSGGQISGGGGNQQVPSANGGSDGGPDGNTSPSTNPNAAAANPNLPAATPQAVQTIGRFISDANGGLTFAWTGSTLQATFTGTGIAVSLTELTAEITWPGSPTDANGKSVPEGNRYAATVDGQTQQLKPSPGTSTYTLASGLAAGTHTVKLVKLTEARVGVTRFNGFQVAGGQLTPVAHTPKHRLLMIGDSITAGYGDLGQSASCTFSPDTQDGNQSWGMVAAQALGVDVQVIAYSGKGVYRNNFDATDQIGNETMSTLWTMALPDDPQAPFDLTTYPADAVVINLGTNDFYRGTPPQASFVAALQALVTQVRQNFPSAAIFLGVGPMLYDNNSSSPNERSLCLTWTNQVVSALNDSKVFVLQLTFPDDSYLSGCDGHPSAAGQAILASQLVTALQKNAGW